MFYIEQTEGRQKDTAERIREHMKHNDTAAAQAALQTIIPGFEHDLLGITWFTYNAPHRALTYLPAGAYERVSHIDDSYQKHKALTHVATQMAGGTWRVVYEY